MDLHLKDVERILGASQLGFQEATMKQIQSSADQMYMMIKSQQPNLPHPVESENTHWGSGVSNVANLDT